MRTANGSTTGVHHASDTDADLDTLYSVWPGLPRPPRLPREPSSGLIPATWSTSRASPSPRSPGS